MKFDPEFRDKLQSNLKLEKSSFKKEIVKFITDNINSGNQLSLIEISDLYSTLKIELENIIDIVNRSFESQDNFKLQLRNSLWPVFRENEIKIEIIKNEPLALHSPEEIKYRVDNENFEYECEKIFWEDGSNLKNYRQLSEFNCFIDLEFSSNEYKKYLNKGNIYNINDWITYIGKLIEFNFPEFVLDKSISNSVKRFTKILDNDIKFGFEYDEKDLIKLFKDSSPSLPEYFNLIIINNDFSPKANKNDYILKYNQDIFSLGMLNNPFLYSGMPLESFSIIELYHYGDCYPKNIDPKKIREYIQQNNETIRLVHSVEYGEKLKKHAFFYMSLLGTTTKIYLNYLEKAITNSIN